MQLRSDNPLADSQVGLDSAKHFFGSISRIGNGDAFVVLDPVGDFSFGRDYRAMTSAAKVIANFRERGRSVLPREIHRQHPSRTDLLATTGGFEFRGLNAAEITNGLFNRNHRSAIGSRKRKQILKDFLSDFGSHRFSG